MNRLSSSFWDEVAEQVSDDTLSLTEIVDRTQISYGAARHALNRRGVYLTRADCKTIRQRVRSMSQADAIDYLLEVVECISWVKLEQPHETDSIKATRSERVILRLLHDANGRVVTKKSIFNALYALKRADDEIPDKKIVGVLICKLRKNLKGSPWSIKNVFGLGYQLQDNRIPARSGDPT